MPLTPPLQPCRPPTHQKTAQVGSNMAPAVLTGRRGVRPRASAPAAAPALRLSFGMVGFPFSEPAFATLVAPGHPLAAGGPAAPPAHGVVHVISAAEWRRVCETEGVSSSGAGYQVVEVDCFLYSRGGPWGGPSSVATAGGSSGNNGSSSGKNCGGDGGGGAGGGAPARVRALTLQGAEASLHRGERGALPSARYLGLLREGAMPCAGRGRLWRCLQRPARREERAARGWATEWHPMRPRRARRPLAPPLAPGAAFHGLDPSYRSYLDSLEAYSPGPGPSLPRAAGALAAAAAAAAAAAPVVPLLAAVQLLDAAAGPRRGSGGGGSDSGGAAAAGLVGAAAGRVAWAVHDAVLEPAFGSGCRNEPPK
jgi:hypothetical protein